MVTAHKREICGWISENGSTNFSPIKFLQFPCAGDLHVLLKDLKQRLAAWQRALTALINTSPTTCTDTMGEGTRAVLHHIAPPEDLQKWEEAWKVLRYVLDPTLTPSTTDTSASTAVAAFLSQGVMSGGGGKTSSPSGPYPPLQDRSPLQATALLLALYGWEVSAADSCAKCPLCSRAFELTPAPPPPSPSPDVATSAGQTVTIDVAKMHRYFCPWVCPYEAWPQGEGLASQGTVASSDRGAFVWYTLLL